MFKKLILLLFFCGLSTNGMNQESIADINEQRSDSHYYTADNSDERPSLLAVRDARVRSNLSFTSADESVGDRNAVNNIQRATSVYIPQNIEIDCCLNKEAKCCFCIARWVLQPLNVILPLAATTLIAAGEYYMDASPKTARVLNTVGLVCSAAEFITSVLLIKVNNKLERIDRHFEDKAE